MKLTINGEPKELTSSMPIDALLTQLGLLGKRLAVEINGELVPRSLHAATMVNDGDSIEIVRAVGGG